jgi:hypothetical protein
VARDQIGHGVHDAWTIHAADAHCVRQVVLPRLGLGALGQELQAELALQAHASLLHPRNRRFAAGHQHQKREFATENGHPAILQVGARIAHQLRNRVDEAGPIRPHRGQHQMALARHQPSPKNSKNLRAVPTATP